MCPADTTPEAWELYLELQRRMTPEERLRRAFEWSNLVRAFTEAGLRQAYPQASDREIFLRRARLQLGPDLFRRAYGDVLPEDGPPSRST